MTLSPFSDDGSDHNHYDDEPERNPFQAFKPTSRSFTTGSFPIKTFQAQNGAEIRILYATQLTGKKMTLTYVNLSDADAYMFFQHYVQQRGSYKTFQLGDINSEGSRVGWGSENGATDAGDFNMIWRYADEPQLTSVYPGVSSITIELIAVPKI
jgi:hypothetical protein